LVVPEIRAAMSVLDSEISPVTVDVMTDVISRQGLFLPRIVALLGGAYGLILAASGLVVRVAIALIAAPAVRSMLVGVSPYDPATFIAISAALLGATALASYIPAARATR